MRRSPDGWCCGHPSSPWRRPVSSLVIYNQTTREMGPTARVAAVQPGLDNAPPGTLISKRDLIPGRTEEQRIASQTAQLSQITRDAANRGAKVVVWPEETLSYDPRVTHTEWIPAGVPCSSKMSH